MAKSSQKKVVQDVIPKGRSIRNVELTERGKTFSRSKKEQVQDVVPPVAYSEAPKQEKTHRPIVEKQDLYTYEYDEPKQKSKKWFYVSLTVLVIILGFGISAFFKSAEIRVTPKSETKTLDNVFTAKKDTTSGDLGFQLVTVSKDVEKTVEATGDQTVETKAKGIIVIYNNYSKASQKLVATTRFQTPEGLIFRLVSAVTVPGQQTKSGKLVAGSVEAAVVADAAGDAYNIGLKDFTIPGLKGDPKYAKIYGRSKTEMTGGFSGIQKVVSTDVMAQTNTELETTLKDGLSKDITSQIPANFVLYSQSISYSLDPITQGTSSTGSVVLHKKGTGSAIIFDKGLLSKAIFAKVAPDLTQDIAKITNLEDLTFSYAPGTSFTPNTSTTVTFNLQGDADFVWIFDENKLKSDLLGLSKKNAETIIATYSAIKEAWVTTHPFWNQTIPLDPAKVTLINTLSNPIAK